MAEKIISFDIETENTGSDVRQDNKRIISIQLYDGNKEELFYADSVDAHLEMGKERIKSLLNDDYIFVGYYVSKFDIPLLREFLEIEIPTSNYIDISFMDKVVEIQKLSGKYSLQDVCKEAGVNCSHKKLLEPIIERLKQDPEIIERAKRDGLTIANRNNWTLQFSRDRALNLICGGSAILDAYHEFVKSDGNTDTIFYRYAIGDVKSEYELFCKIKGIN